MNDNDFSTFLADANVAMRRQIARAEPTPDFEDVMARAHDRDPTRVSAADVEAAQTLAPIVRMRTALRDRNTEDRFEQFLSDARVAIERKIEAREGTNVAPELRRVRPRRRMALSVGAVGVAAAAACVLLFGMSNVRMLVRAPDSAPSQALDGSLREGESRSVDVIERNLAKAAPELDPPLLGPPVPAMMAPDAIPAVPAIETIPTTATSNEARGERGSADRMTLWMNEAQARWRAGDLDGAEERLHDVIRVGGRAPIAEMAYGDLFALAHQRHSVRERTRLWRAYLKRFPNGRFADDAASGLCRVANDDGNSVQCWQDYLTQFERGSYRGEAQRKLETAR